MSLVHSIIVLVTWALLLGGGIWGRLRYKQLKDELSPEASKAFNALLLIMNAAALAMIVPLATLFNALCGF